jgi:hypothetical protein
MDLVDCRALLSHAEWADALVWKAVLACGAEDGELRARLHHLHMVQWSHLHVWRAEQVRPRELSTFPTLAAIRGWAREYYRELPAYVAAVSAADLTREVRLHWADRLVRRFGGSRPPRGRDRSPGGAQQPSPGAGGEGCASLARISAQRLPFLDLDGPPEADWGEGKRFEAKGAVEEPCGD